jgi:2-dehydro-3-deoxyphosphooctonate aldolase (KDO 8-P synthase)
MDIPILKYKNASPEKLLFLAGPCVIESRDLCFSVASKLEELVAKHNIDIIFKASYDKANRTSKSSFRGLGREEGLRVLSDIRIQYGLPTLTDIHESNQAKEAADAVDILQIPAFLCRQTDLLAAAALTGKIVNVKKGQFMAPSDMKHSLEKAGSNSWLTERGTFFGYNRLVVDFAGFPTLKSFGHPFIFDATHSVQAPGGGDGCSSGNRTLAVPLAKAAVAMGVDGLFFEIHPDPDKALCDGPNCISVADFEKQISIFINLKSFLDSCR